MDRGGSVIVGRTQELEALDALVEDLRAGSGRALVLCGDAGIGKTTLLGALADRELYPEVVDAPIEEGGVPSRLLKTRPPEGGEGRHAMVDVRRFPVGEDNEIAVTLDDLAREGARRMIATALEVEVAEYIERCVDERGEDGKRLVVRNGHARERGVTVGSGTVVVRAPRVNDKRVDEETGERQRFSSRILPAYARRSPRSTTCCRCCTCAACRPATSARRWSNCSVRMRPACRRRRSRGCARTGRPSTSGSAPGRCASTSTPTCSLTASTFRSGSARTTGSACWS